MSPATQRLVIAVGAVVALGLLVFACFERREVERSSLDSLEAKTNVYYAAERFLEEMGADTERTRDAEPPAPGATWMLTTSRVEEVDPDELRSWLLAGGRLLLFGDRCGCAWSEVPAFAEWGVLATELETAAYAALSVSVPGRAEPLALELEDATRFEAPGVETTWWIEDEHGALLLGFPVGDGEVILAVNNDFLRNDEIARLDHAELLWRLVGEGRPEPTVRFTSGSRRTASAGPNLLAVLWERARPLMIAALVLLFAWAWMRARRFGPVTPDPPPVRRRLLEHVEATGHLAWRLDRGVSLLGAMRARLERECALRHPGWRALPEREREQQLAALAGLPVAAVARALRDAEVADADVFRERVIHLERMRKAL